MSETDEWARELARQMTKCRAKNCNNDVFYYERPWCVRMSYLCAKHNLCHTCAEPQCWSARYCKKHDPQKLLQCIKIADIIEK